ncbi:threonine aldolase [Peribacillus simplex]|nr:threonine aldolase [Peribacillus simplex]
MMEAIQQAELGDDVYGQDVTVNQLESLAATIVGMEAACFMPSGTMANLASIMAHCPRGSKVLVGNESDIYIYEAAGASVCGGIMYEPIQTQPDGSLLINDLQRAIPIDLDDPQFALPSLLCLENTHNRCGGKPLSFNYLKEVRTFADQVGISIHMDGARIFNAAVSLGVHVSEIAKYVDSLQFCLSKGLSAPVGSIVAGTKEHVDKVRRIRKMLGGGMRQAGILAAPAIIALKYMTDRLIDDHRRAKQLAKGLEEVPGIEIVASDVQSNILMFKIVDERYTWQTFLQEAEHHGLIFSEMGYERIRAVIHRHISDKDIETTLSVIHRFMTEGPKGKNYTNSLASLS